MTDAHTHGTQMQLWSRWTASHCRGERQNRNCWNYIDANQRHLSSIVCVMRCAFSLVQAISCIAFDWNEMIGDGAGCGRCSTNQFSWLPCESNGPTDSSSSSSEVTITPVGDRVAARESRCDKLVCCGKMPSSPRRYIYDMMMMINILRQYRRQQWRRRRRRRRQAKCLLHKT